MVVSFAVKVTHVISYVQLHELTSVVTIVMELDFSNINVTSGLP